MPGTSLGGKSGKKGIGDIAGMKRNFIGELRIVFGASGKAGHATEQRVYFKIYQHEDKSLNEVARYDHFLHYWR